MINRIYDILPVSKESVKNIYMYGSRVYGNYNENSDYDFLIIGDFLKYQEINKNNINVHIFNNKTFQFNLNNYEMRAIECYMAPNFAKIKEDNKFDFKLNKNKFKSSILFEINKNWRIGKRKFKENDIYGGKKRIYHTIRLLMFGIQILKNGEITNWTEANKYHKEIMNDIHTEWNYYRLKYEIIKKDLEIMICKNVN